MDRWGKNSRALTLPGLKLPRLSVEMLLGLSLALLVHLRSLLPGGLTELVFLGVLVFTLARQGSYSKERLALLASFLLLPASTFLSLVLANAPEEGFKYAAILLYNVVLFGFIVNLRGINFFSVLRPFLFVSALVGVVTFGALCLFYGAGVVIHELLFVRGLYARGQGFSGGPNYYSIGMMVSFFAAWFFWSERGKGLIYFILIGFGLFSSLSRGAILAVAFFVFASYAFDRSLRRMVFRVAAIGAGLVVLVMLITPPERLGQIADVLESRVFDRGGGGQSRIAAFTRSLEAYSQGNLITGAGRADYRAFTHDGAAPHNTFVTILSDGGLVSAIVLWLMMLFILLRSASIFNRDHRPLFVFLSLLLAALTNDYHFTKEWWLGLALVYVGCDWAQQTQRSDSARV